VINPVVVNGSEPRPSVQIVIPRANVGYTPEPLRREDFPGR
jgi:hypothetical protein